MGGRFGSQPVHWILYRQHWTIRRAAKEMGVPEQHLGRAVRGQIRPDDVVRAELPKLLNCPLEDLFTAESLKPFTPKPRWVNG